jgi:opacity protein-like surface antigen
LLATVTLKLPNRTGIVPFASAGAGVAFTFFNADDLVNDPGGPNEFILDGSESDAVFAWQLSAGLKYQLNDRMSMGVAYKFLYTGEPDWEAQRIRDRRDAHPRGDFSLHL